jgi:hypothetical protein
VEDVDATRRARAPERTPAAFMVKRDYAGLEVDLWSSVQFETDEDLEVLRETKVPISLRIWALTLIYLDETLPQGRWPCSPTRQT